MATVTKPIGVVSQRNNNKYIWDGEASLGVPLTSMRIIITSPFIISTDVLSLNNYAEFNFKDFIENYETEVEVLSVTPYHRILRKVNQIFYNSVLNGGIFNPTENFYFTNGAYQFGETDLFQSLIPVFLVENIYAWNSFPIYVPIFIPDNVDQTTIYEVFNGDTTLNFSLSGDNVLYSRNLTDLLPQGQYDYEINIDSTPLFKKINYIDRCGYRGVNLVPNSNHGTYGNNPASEVLVLSPDDSITAVAPIPDSNNNRFQETLLSSNINTNEIYTYSWYSKRLSTPDLDFTGDLRISSLVNISIISIEQISIAKNGFNRFKATFNIIDGNLDAVFKGHFGDVIGIGNNSVAYWGHQLNIGSNAITPLITTPISFTSIDRSNDFYLRWLNLNNDWEFWLFDCDFIEELESEYKGISEGEIYKSLGKNVEITKILTASNLQPDMYNKVKSILIASKVELLIDNNPNDLKYMEVFVRGDLDSNTKQRKSYIQIEMSEQPFVNN